MRNTSPPSKSSDGNLQPKGFPSLPQGWRTEHETFPSLDGKVSLFAAIHRKESAKGGAEAPFRMLVILHGQGEHGGRYLHAPHYLQSRVDAVFCIDHRGHGRSEGLRGHVDRFDEYTDDAALAVHRVHERLRNEHERFEIHLLGHSMGGLIALRLLFLHANLPLKSVTVSAPLLALKMKVPLAKRLAARALSGTFGSLQLPTGLDPADVSHDPEVQQTYLQDRLVHNKSTPRFFTELQEKMADTRRRTSGLIHPIQFLIPLKDRIVDSEASLKFFRSLKHNDKQLQTYPEFRHESFNEIGKEQAFEDLGKWIETHP